MNLLFRVLAWFAALPYVVVAFLVLTGVASWSAVLYVLAAGVLLGGLATLPLPEKPRGRRRGVSRAAAAAIVAIALIRTFTAARGRTLELTDGDGGSARIVDRVVD